VTDECHRGEKDRWNDAKPTKQDGEQMDTKAQPELSKTGSGRVALSGRVLALALALT
jgi:hypothetical protein